MCESVSYHIPSHESLYEEVVILIKNIFPINEDEIKLVKFIGCYQYLSIQDIKFFFKDISYYKKRITRLVKNNIIRRYKKHLVLAENGKHFLELLGQNTVRLRYQEKYADRLKYISHLAAFYNQEKFINFTPSFEFKDKTVFTESSRKYIGILKIFGTNYLTYHIAEKHNTKYINSIYYDLQKETKYKNIIILIDDISRINLTDFIFGLNSVLICEDNDTSLAELKFLQQIDWNKVIYKLYGNKIHLSEYNFCDYTDNKDKYISTFNFIDTEKINRINIFIKNNANKQADIICNQNIEKILR